MKWVVLSDLHMNFKNCTTEIARKKLIDVLKKESGISFILITGDCLNQNKGDLGEIKEFLIKLMRACNINKNRIILCPGNHDIDRNVVNRNEQIEIYREKGELPDLNICLDGYSRFKEFYSLFYGKSYKPFTIKNIDNFRIIAIDSCLVSKDGKDYGYLAVNFTKLSTLEIKKDDKINVVVMHHGVEWLHPEEGRRFQHWLVDNNVRMVFCGHNHAPGMNILTEAIGEKGIPRDGIPQFTCGCTLSDSYSKPVFLIGENMEESVEIKLYEYMDDSRWEIARGILRSFPDGIYQESTTSGVIKNSYDVPKIYNTIFDMGADAEQDIKTSKKLDFFGLRGGTFLKGNSKIANALYEKGEDITCRLLVSDPYNAHIEKRLRNVSDYYKQLNLEAQWKVNYQDIKRLRDNLPKISSWNLRFHELPLLFRFIITDSYVYFGYYTREPSSKSRMYRYTSQSSLYKSLTDFFNSAWENANTNFSSIIPDRCSFILDKFDMKPSLVINITSKCNMDCWYCPRGGENLKECDSLCEITQIEYLLKAYAEYYKEKNWKEKKVVRITGGEPLLDIGRLLKVLECAKENGYEKIVLCTNGLLLRECYIGNEDIWESVKSILLLKISLDSMDEDVFEKLTKSKEMNIVLENIEFAKEMGFNIELNFVGTKSNVQEIENIYDYAYGKKLIGLKVLTINDFGGQIKVDNVEKELNILIEKMRKKNYIETGLYVHNNKGIHMKRFIRDGCTLTIVDHMNREKSVTPRRTYSESCDGCPYYPESRQVKFGKVKPCATGIMSLTMRADGILSYCRLRANKGTSLIGKNFQEVKEIVNEQLKKFENCYHYEIGEKK